MKAKVFVRLKPEVLDVQGRAVEQALASLGIRGIQGVRVGKLIEIEIDAAPGAALDAELRKACDELLANPVIEDFEIETG
jgi:phosphoribosylformylglycinamidine synthase